MSPSTHRWLNRLANAGLALAIALAFLPIGMRAYGHWTEAAQRRRFLASARTSVTRVQQGARWGWEPALIRIPRLGVDAPVEEVKDSWYMVPGPGHDPATVGPGSPGNCVIGAHRNMWDSTFAHLPRLRSGDRVELVTATKRYVYRVDSSRQVKSYDTAPLQDTPTPTLTLYTCMLPVSDDQRWVVRAHLSEVMSAE